MLCNCSGAFPGEEGGIQVLAGLATSSKTVGSFLRKPWLAKRAGKIQQTSLLDEFASMENTLNYFGYHTFGKVKISIILASSLELTLALTVKN